jgi:hypothetical protein
MAYTALGELSGNPADSQEGFLRLWAGETLATFQETNKFMPLIQSRTISNAKSATFPVIGTAASRWHSPGESLITDADAGSTAYNSQIALQEKEIFIDDVLTSSVLVDDLETMKVHWDVRSEYTSAIGRALAKEVDEHILATIFAGASAAETITGVTGAPVSITDTDANTNGTSLTESIQEMAQKFDENDVPNDGQRIVALAPDQYYNLMQMDSKLISRDYVGNTDALSNGQVMRIAGIQIVMTNNLGSGDLSGSADDYGARNDPFGAGDGYNGDWSNVVAIGFHRSGVGGVKMADLSVQSEYLLERLAHLMVAKLACGFNYLRPEACAVIKTA